MRSVVKLPLMLSEAQERILDSQSRMANWLYNHLLEIANKLRTAYRQKQNTIVGRRLYTERGFRDLVPLIKDRRPFLKTVHSSVLKNVALRLSGAIKNSQDGKKGKRPPMNWPRFKAWKRDWFSLQYDEANKGFRLKGREVTFVFGKDQSGKQITLVTKLSESLPAWVNLEQIKQCRIVKDANIYSIVLTVERALPNGKPIQKVVAIDPNHKNFGYAVGTDGVATEIHNPYFLKPLDKRIDQLKAKRDRTKKKSKKVERADGSSFWLASRRWQYLNKRLQDVYRLRREQTKVYLYTVANRLFKHYDIVSIGDYVPRGGGITRKMRRAMNNQSLNRRFKQVVAWVALRSGKQSYEWAEKGSTRTCHDCGFVVAEGIPPSIRAWDCPDCRTAHIRDENSARNGLERTLKAFGLPCSGRVAVLAPLRCTWRFSGLGLPSGGRWRVLKQEPTSKQSNQEQASS